MFSTFGGFFAAYIPLVILAIIGVWNEDKLEGLAFGIENEKISSGLLDIAEAIDGVIKDESERDTE